MLKLPEPHATSSECFSAGFWHSITSVYALVLFGTYVGVGALAHDLGFSALWLTISTTLIWAAPAQVILITAVAAGSSLLEAALAVTLSAVRLLPMVITLLPLVRTPQTRTRDLVFTTHFIAISVWIESLRLMPMVPLAQRMPFGNGIAIGLNVTAMAAGLVGFYLAAGLPLILAAALLFITPISFLISAVRNSHELMEKLAFGLGLVICPLLTWYAVDLDLLWTGIIAGGVAYGVRRLRMAAS